MSSPGTAAPSGLASFLNATPAPVTTSSSTQYPPWLQQILQSTIQGGASAASAPYNPFPGPLVAAPSAQTTQAQTMAGANVGNYQPALNAASNLVQGSAAPITDKDVSTFLNPYENYVTGALNRNLQQNILPGIQDKFVGAGQSRSPQEAQVTGDAVYGTQQAAGQALAGSYQGALNSLQQQRQQQMNAGNTLGQLGSLTQSLGERDVSQLAASGATQDQYAQSNINAALNQFQQQQQYPYQQIGFLANLLNSVPLGVLGPTSTKIESGQVYGASPLTTYSSTLANLNGISGNNTGTNPVANNSTINATDGSGGAPPLETNNNIQLARGGRVMRNRIGALQQMRMAA